MALLLPCIVVFLANTSVADARSIPRDLQAGRMMMWRRMHNNGKRSSPCRVVRPPVAPGIE
jgi:hypothetical protein